MLCNEEIRSIKFSSSNSTRMAHNIELSISVKRDSWPNGIGSAVMEELLRFVKERGTIRYVSLGVKASNHNAIAMYKKFGFKKIGVHKNYNHYPYISENK